MTDQFERTVRIRNGKIPESLLNLGTAAAQDVEAFQTAAAVDVRDYGAPGNGQADETAALVDILNANPGKRVQLAPNGNHIISGTLPVTGELDGRGATLTVTADMDGIKVPALTSVKDLRVKVTSGAYTKTAVQLDTAGGYNVLQSSVLDHIWVEGASNTTGVAFGADDGGVKGVLTYMVATRLYATKIGTGLRLKNVHAESWMNGNRFEINQYNVSRFVVLDGVCDTNIIHGQFQCNSATTVGIRVNGNGNDFGQVQIWDWHPFPSITSFDLTGSSYTIIPSGNVGPVKGASPATIRPPQGDHATLVRPKVKDRSPFVTKSGSTLYAYEGLNGQQDNILMNANLFHTVTSSWGTSPANAFTSGGATVNQTMDPGTTYTITVDASNVPLTALQVIGVLFAQNMMPDQLTIETEDSVGARVARYTSTDFADPNQYTKTVVPGTVHKIHVMMTTTTSKQVRIGSIFASSGAIQQKAFLQTNGGTVYGDIHFGSGGLRRRRLSRSTSYTLAGSDDIVTFNGATLTATLPSAATVLDGKTYTVKNLNSSSLTVATTSSQTIDGAATQSLAQWQTGRYVSDGTNWLSV